MRFVFGLLIGILVGGVAGIALSASGVLNPRNCKVCKLFSKGCGTDASSKP